MLQFLALFHRLFLKMEDYSRQYLQFHNSHFHVCQQFLLPILQLVGLDVLAVYYSSRSTTSKTQIYNIMEISILKIPISQFNAQKLGYFRYSRKAPDY